MAKFRHFGNFWGVIEDFAKLLYAIGQIQFARNSQL